MQKVISINLNGNAYQVEETGYAALVAYLEGAQRQLKDNPDRAEIIADLEQAIAEKCRRFLNAHKSVVTDGEVDQIIREMGPVDAEPGSSEQAGATGGAKAGGPKRLYLLREGAMLAGVCNGMAAYLHIDPTIVRIVFVLLAILTKGVFFFVYVVLAVVIPPANTPEERAAAYGETFNAQELIDRAKRTYAGFTAGHGRFGDWGRDWGRHWRRQERQWRRQFDRTMRSRRWESAPAFVPPAGYTARVVAGVMVPLLTVVSALLFWVGAYAVLSLATERQAFGVPLSDDIPLWAGILFLVFLYQSAAWPLHAARRASYHALGGPHYAAVAALDGLLSVGVGLCVVWFAYQYMPEVRELLRTLPDVWDSMRR